MLNQTTEIAIKALIYLTLKASPDPVPPRELADALRESGTYMSKVTALLIRAGILRAQRGAAGGVMLLRNPAEVTLLEIVEACQGKILADYCRDVDDTVRVCAFHKAMLEVHESVTSILARWTLSDLAGDPSLLEEGGAAVTCKMNGVCPKGAGNHGGKGQRR